MNSLAHHYGGKCLSKEYIQINSSYEWMCKRGHKWNSNYYWIKMGHWCARCLKEVEKERQLENYKVLAAKKGGKCLSTEYINSDNKLKWQCAKGHVWETRPSRIKTWCAQCARDKTINKLLEEFKTSHGFILISKYKNSNEILQWRCENGHVIQAPYKNLKADYGCPKCNREKRLNQVKGYLEELNLIAKKWGGKMLSKKYINNYTKMDWQCKEGHTWSANASGIKLGSWCPTCGIVKRRNTIEEMQMLAKEHNGNCLSTSYINGHTHLKWQCEEGHTWETNPAVIANGGWCPECSGVKRVTIFDMQAIAETRGGKCLSKKFINTAHKIKWQCDKGHTWESVASSVRAGSWCPYCNGTARGTIGEARKSAKKMGGKCLTSEYTNNRENMEWQCAKGHIWKATFHAVKSGTWCPYCAVEKNTGTRNLFKRWGSKKIQDLKLK
ncbi:MAG: hypothetical protein ABIT08_14775 [Bacteroidia bacterium]